LRLMRLPAFWIAGWLSRTEEAATRVVPALCHLRLACLRGVGPGAGQYREPGWQAKCWRC